MVFNELTNNKYNLELSNLQHLWKIQMIFLKQKYNKFIN